MRFLASILSVILVLQPLLAQQKATFSATTNVVIVNVTVLDRNGRPIPNLTKDDFLLYEDGKLQKLQAVDFQNLKNDVLPPPTEPQPAPEPQQAPVAMNYNPAPPPPPVMAYVPMPSPPPVYYVYPRPVVPIYVPRRPVIIARYGYPY